MQVLVYSVFDSKAETFGTPMFFLTKGIALRAFSDVCADAGSPMAKHPNDYTLFQIGSYDANTGKLTDLTPAVHVVAASSIVSLLRPAGQDKPSLDALSNAGGDHV